MKRLLLALGLLFCAANAGAQTTTFNGIVKDLTNTPVPTGQVTFTLKPGIDTTISGSSRFVPATTFCEIHNPGVVSTSGTGTITAVVDTAQNWLAGDSLIFVGTADATLNASSVASPYTITVRNSSTSFVFTQSGAHVNGAAGTVGGLYKSGGTGACAVMQNTAITPQATSYTVGIQAIFAQPSSFNTYAIGSGPIDISTVVPTPSQMPAYSFVDTASTQVISAPKSFLNPCNIAGMIYVTGGGCYLTPQAAIAACPATDCWVVVPPNSYPVPTNLRSHLRVSGYVQGLPAATMTAATNLVWGTPPADNKIIFTSATGTTLSGIWDLTIEGITFDCGGNSVNCLVAQNGVFESHFGTPASKIVIQNCGTGAALTLSGGSVSGQSVAGNDFDVSIFNAGKGVVLTATAPGVAANNKFHSVHINNVSVRAIEFVQQSDSNRFEWTFISGLGNAAGGISFNTGTPGSDTGVANNVFEHCLCADPLNPGSYTGTLVTVNKSVHPNVIADWEIGPGITSGGGTELSNPNNYPFLFNITSDFTNGTSNDGALSLTLIRNFSNTATMGIVQKKGTVAGNYTTTSTGFTAVDGTNLSNAVTVPVGWKLGIQSSGSVAQSTAAATLAVALYDGACGAGTLLHAELINPTAVSQWLTFSLSVAITGDGNSHTVNLCYDTSNAADAAAMLNTAGQGFPIMLFTLMPSN